MSDGRPLAKRLSLLRRIKEGELGALESVPDTRAYEDGSRLNLQIRIERLREEIQLLGEAVLTLGRAPQRFDGVKSALTTLIEIAQRGFDAAADDSDDEKAWESALDYAGIARGLLEVALGEVTPLSEIHAEVSRAPQRTAPEELARVDSPCLSDRLDLPRPPTGSSPDRAELDLRGKRDGIPRHTIEQQSGTIYCRLVEDADGAWVTFANHNAIVTKLEQRIEKAEAAVAAERERCAQIAEKVGDAAEVAYTEWDAMAEPNECDAHAAALNNHKGQIKAAKKIAAAIRREPAPQEPK